MLDGVKFCYLIGGVTNHTDSSAVGAVLRRTRLKATGIPNRTDQGTAQVL